MDLAAKAETIEKRVKELAIVKAWELKMPIGTKYTDPWIERAVDPICIQYDRKEFEMTVTISTRGGDCIVILRWTHRKIRSWDDEGPSDTELKATLEKAIKLCEMCWNEHIMRPEMGRPAISITIDVE